MGSGRYAGLLILILTGCQVQNYKATNYDYSEPYDTSTKPIALQVKKVFSSDSSDVYADNQFAGARLNDFIQINDSTYRAIIAPENRPINPSPWYAFKIWSEEDQQVTIQMDYSGYKYRYRPKTSSDGEHWELLDSASIGYTKDSTFVTFRVDIDSDTLLIAGQEVINSNKVAKWCKTMSENADVKMGVLGKSKLGRDLYFLDVYKHSKKNKKTVVVFCRQHPPEVTGYFAMQAFSRELLGESALAREFREKYRVLIFPLLNPDGVDLGHWRHSAGGVDLNRDWGYYRQPEVRQVADFIVKETKTAHNQVVLGLDFHSTYHDVFYTNENTKPVIDGFRSKWLAGLEKDIPNYTVNEKPSEIKRPVSKSWFYTQFQAEGITYEIGDQTSREFIELKGRSSAKEMMLLLQNEF